MNRTPSPVGFWSFTRPDPPVDRFDEATLRNVVALIAESLPVLGRHGLLVPARVVLADWRAPLGCGVEDLPGLPDGAPLEIPLAAEAGAGGLEDAVLGPVRERQAFPLAVHVHGRGQVLDAAGGSDDVPDLVHLQGTAMLGAEMYLTTDVDVWLPYDLRAVEQWDVHAANAPRLEAALRELGSLPGVTTGHVEMTRWAEVEDLRLRNHHDVFGRPNDVLGPYLRDP